MTQTIRRVWAACGLWLVTVTLGCTAETASEIDGSQLASDDSNLGEVSQALEQFPDRPAAAAVGVGVDGGEFDEQREMWVFVCKSNNILYRRVKPAWNQPWEPSWVQVSSIPCAGVPTVGAGSARPKDDVDLYYRSTANHLINVYFYPNGTFEAVDLTATLGLGGISGNPVIANMGTNGSVAVAYRNPLNHLKTITWTPQAGWTKQSVTDADGIQVRADGLLTAMYTPQLSYLSSSFNNNYGVFSRTNWVDPYSQINTTIINSRGVLTFVAQTADTMLLINRNGRDQVTKSAVVPGQPWSFTLANQTVVKATPYMGGAWSYDHARFDGINSSAGVSYYDSGEGEVTTLWGHYNRQTVTYQYVGMHLRSAGTRPVNPGRRMDKYVFFASNNYRLYWANLWSESGFNGAFHDMGINVPVP